MSLPPRLILGSMAALASTAPAAAQTLDLSITVPHQRVAEYHRPYVAVWLEKAGQAPRTLSVWYDYDMRKGEGTKWLRDLRQWWRVSGRSMRFPADGVTGATRAPGAQRLSFVAGRGPLGGLTPGNYTLLVEAAREVGGHEVVRVPFTWPPRPGTVVRAAGHSELGAISLGFRK